MERPLSSTRSKSARARTHARSEREHAHTHAHILVLALLVMARVSSPLLFSSCFERDRDSERQRRLYQLVLLFWYWKLCRNGPSKKQARLNSPVFRTGNLHIDRRRTPKKGPSYAHYSDFVRNRATVGARDMPMAMPMAS
jgi:hypothetical protein